MNKTDTHDRTILQGIAHRAMLERGFFPNFSADALDQLDKIHSPKTSEGQSVRDLRNLLWASIDNDDSRDLDQLTVAESILDGNAKILVAVADVDSLVERGSALDEHARHNTTSVYTVAQIFPMFPEKLSTNFTSLGINTDRLSIVLEMVISADGSVKNSAIYRAFVRNHAKLAYNSVAAWLEDTGPIPNAILAVKGLDENLRLQSKVAQVMKNLRHTHGALSLETIEARPVFADGKVRGLEVEQRNKVKDLIEDFMIASNGVTARYLAANNFPSIRRIIRIPERWERIVEIANAHNFQLPANPDSKALEEFLVKMKAADPSGYPDLSLSVIKLIGKGEYAAEFPGQTAPGHFGLAVKDYAHSTAPNRLYTDIITQRLLKAAIDGRAVPYNNDELVALAQHCTDQENAANKVERQVGKSAAALLLASRIGNQFDAIVTGASSKGTWVRILNMPVEGRVIQGFDGIDVGNRIRVQLLSVDVQHGFIDFKKVN